MPAHRSTCEAEIRDAVVARLRLIRPRHRIIHEIQNACNGPNRLDVIAVGLSEIIAVEVKSKKDKIDRLPAQIAAMRGMSHHVIAAIHEKFLVPPKWESNVPCVTAPPQARGATVWAYPVAGADQGRSYGCAAWEDPRQAVMQCLPQGALDMLWADELYQLCASFGIGVTRRHTRPQMINVLRWQISGGALTRGVCAALRRRTCIEADPEIDDVAVRAAE